MGGASPSALTTHAEATPHIRPSFLQWVGGLLVSFVVFYPSLISPLVSARLLLIITCTALAASTLKGRRSSARRVLLVIVVGLYAVLGTFVSNQIAEAADDPLLATNIQRLYIVTPILFVAGVKMYRTTAGSALARSFVVVATPTAALAVAEVFVGRSLFGRQLAFEAMMRDGGTRAILSSDHALVLGALLSVAIPLTAFLSTRPRIVSILVLIAGVAATGSRGPLTLALIFGVISLSVGASSWIQRHFVFVRVIAVSALALLGYLSGRVWTTDVIGTTGADYSTNYRWAIYSSLSVFLENQPSGYGLGTFPSGVWLVQSEVFGVRDILATLDSELVYSGFTLGWTGVALVVFAFLCSVIALRHDLTVGLTGALISLVGFGLALHAWDGLGSVWLLVTGAAFGACLRARQREKPIAVRRRRVPQRGLAPSGKEPVVRK